MVSGQDENLSEEARRARAEELFKKRAEIEKAKQRKIKAEVYYAKSRQAGDENLTGILKLCQELKKEGEERLEKGVMGFENPFSLYNSLSPFYRKVEKLSGKCMVALSRLIFIMPARETGLTDFIRNKTDAFSDMLKKTIYGEKEVEVRVPKVSFHVGLKPDNTVDPEMFGTTFAFDDEGPLREREKRAFVDAFQNWVETTSGKKGERYEFVQASTIDPTKKDGFFICEKGTKNVLTKTEFEALPQSFEDYLTLNYGRGFEFSPELEPKGPTPM